LKHFDGLRIRQPDMIFRGIDAAASLKLRDDVHAELAGELIFRGIDAAASLKRRFRLFLFVDHQADLPRHRCRGLIEAGHIAARLPDDGLIFRGIDAAASLKLLIGGQAAWVTAHLPRHRCRGLIEARTSRY